MIPNSVKDEVHRLHGGRCVYCGHLTWKRQYPDLCWAEPHITQLGERFGIPQFRPRKKWLLKIRHLEGTMEHVTRVVDGGDDHLENLVLACMWCNTARECRTPTDYLDEVAFLISMNQHPVWGKRTPDDDAKAAIGLRLGVPSGSRLGPEMTARTGYFEKSPVS